MNPFKNGLQKTCQMMCFSKHIVMCVYTVNIKYINLYTNLIFKGFFFNSGKNESVVNFFQPLYARQMENLALASFPFISTVTL